MNNLSENLKESLNNPRWMTDEEIVQRTRDILTKHGIVEAGTCDKQRLLQLVRTIRQKEETA